MGRTTKRQKPPFAKNASDRAKALGMNWHEVAQIAKIPHPTVRDILAGISPGLEENRKAIAKALGCSMADLYGEARTPHIIPVNSEELIERISGILSQRDESLKMEISRLEIEFKTIGEKIQAVPPEIWNGWKSASTAVRICCLYLISGNIEFLALLPEALRAKLKVVAQGTGNPKTRHQV